MDAAIIKVTSSRRFNPFKKVKYFDTGLTEVKNIKGFKKAGDLYPYHSTTDKLREEVNGTKIEFNTKFLDLSNEIRETIITRVLDSTGINLNEFKEHGCCLRVNGEVVRVLKLDFDTRVVPFVYSKPKQEDNSIKVEAMAKVSLMYKGNPLDIYLNGKGEPIADSRNASKIAKLSTWVDLVSVDTRLEEDETITGLRGGVKITFSEAYLRLSKKDKSSMVQSIGETVLSEMGLVNPEIEPGTGLRIVTYSDARQVALCSITELFGIDVAYKIDKHPNSYCLRLINKAPVRIFAPVATTLDPSGELVAVFLPTGLKEMLVEGEQKKLDLENQFLKLVFSTLDWVDSERKIDFKNKRSK